MTNDMSQVSHRCWFCTKEATERAGPYNVCGLHWSRLKRQIWTREGSSYTVLGRYIRRASAKVAFFGERAVQKSRLRLVVDNGQVDRPERAFLGTGV